MRLELLPTEIVHLAEEYRSNPRFRFAAKHFATCYLDNFKGNFVLNHLSSSELNHLIAAYLFYLYYWREKDDPTSGATLSRVQAFCIERGLAGPRRIAALLGVIQAAGYFKQETPTTDARVKLLKPTPKATAVLKGVLDSHIEAIEIIERNGDYRKYIDSSPEAVIAISSHAFQRLYMGGIKIVDAIEELKPFLEMDNALKIVFSSYINRNNNLIYTTSASFLSKVFGVSRTQVQRIMEKSEKNNLIKILSKGRLRIQLMPPMVNLIEVYISVYLAAMALGTRRAIAFDQKKQ